MNHLSWGILSSSNRKTHLVLNGALPEDQTENVAETFMFGETLTFPTKDIYMHILICQTLVLVQKTDME